MRRIKGCGASILVVLLLTLGCTGCFQSIQPSRRAVVQAIGIDRQGEQYYLTMQVLQGSAEAGKGIGIIEIRGTSLTQMVAELSVQEGREIFLGSLRLAVIGARVAQDGIGHFLQFLNNFHQIPPDLPVVVTGGDAAQLIKLGEKEQSATAQAITEMLEYAKKNGKTVAGTLMETLASLGNPAISACLPLLTVQGEVLEERSAQEGGDNPLLEELLNEIAGQAPKEDAPTELEAESGAEEGGADAPKAQPEVALAGMVIFRTDQLEMKLDDSIACGLGILTRESSAAILVLSLPQGGRASMIIRPSQVRITPEVMGDSIVFNIQIKARAGLSSRSGTTQTSDEYLAGLLETELRIQVEKALSTTLKQGLDPLGLSQWVQQQEPAFYRAHSEKDWPQVLQCAGYAVRVHCTIEQSGAAWKGI